MDLPPLAKPISAPPGQVGPLPGDHYSMLPLVGPTTVRDVWRLPVDNYFDPLGWCARASTTT